MTPDFKIVLEIDFTHDAQNGILNLDFTVCYVFQVSDYFNPLTRKSDTVCFENMSKDV